VFYLGGARFCSIRAVQGFVLFGQCKVLFYSGGARFCSIGAAKGFVLFGRCNSVRSKDVQVSLDKKCGAKKAVGGAKNGGRGLEKKPTGENMYLRILILRLMGQRPRDKTLG
jgi:hypothetical protein